MKAFVRADPNEDPEVLGNLRKRLAEKGIVMSLTDKSWRAIAEPQPFLYYRTPYLRFDRELEIIKFHADNPKCPYLRTVDGEIVSANPLSKEGYPFNLNIRTYFYEPKIEPLPVILGTHKRPEYLHLTLNSLLHSFHSDRQKLYIVASQPDEKTRQIILDTIAASKIPVYAVETTNNLGYAAVNFGTKFFSLPKILHYEDDGIIPENIRYHMPYWTSQMHHRSKTAGWTSIRISDINWTTDFYRSQFVQQSKKVNLPNNKLWFYHKPKKGEIVPIGGLGAVIDCQTMYKDFKPPEWRQSEGNLYFSDEIACIANVPIFHLGSNLEVDYPEYFKNRNAGIKPAKIQVGINMITGESKTIDLSADWSVYS